MFISLCSSVSWYILFECDGKQTSFIFGLKKSKTQTNAIIYKEEKWMNKKSLSNFHLF